MALREKTINYGILCRIEELGSVFTKKQAQNGLSEDVPQL